MRWRARPSLPCDVRLAALAIAVAACSSPAAPAAPADAGDAREDAGPAALDAAPSGPSTPKVHDADHLDVASWNVEWFGSQEYGPKDDDLQQEHVRAVLERGAADLWALVEVVDEARFRAVVTSLDGYEGRLASDAAVDNGSLHYARNEQKLAVVYKKRELALLEARVILTGSSFDFAGRPPLELRFTRLRADGSRVPLTAVVLHAKAGADDEAWQRRAAASAALKSYLDAKPTREAVLVIGDWNDDVGASITPGRPSPYAALAADKARYLFPTQNMARPPYGPREWSALVDHHLVSASLAATLVAGSAAALPIAEWVPTAAETASDHFPVVTRYTF